MASRPADGVVSVGKVASDRRRPAIADEPPSFIQELHHRHLAPDVFREETEGVDRAGYIVGINGPDWIARPLPRIIVPVLRPRGAVQVENDVDVVFLRPGQSL